MVSRAFFSGGTWAFSRPSSPPPASFSALFLHLPSPSPLGLLLFLTFYTLCMLQSTYWLKIHSRTRATLFIDNLNKRHLSLLISQLQIVTTIFLLNFLIKIEWPRWNENKMFLAFFFTVCSNLSDLIWLLLFLIICILVGLVKICQKWARHSSLCRS